MFSAPWPLRRRERSSRKPTSSTQCRLFSTRQWPRTAAAQRAAVSGTDVEAPLTGAAVTMLDPRLDHGHGCDLGKAALARKAAFARHPVDLVRDGAAARLDAAVILVDLGHGLDLIGPGRGKEVRDFALQGR